MTGGWSIELELGGDTKSLSGEDYDSFSFTRREESTANFRLVVMGMEDLHDWKFATLKAHDPDGYFYFEGRVVTVNSSSEQLPTTLRGPGAGVRLSDSGAVFETDVNLPAHEGLAEYLETYVDPAVSNFSWEVTPPTIETVYENEQLTEVEGVRDQLESATNITATDPFDIIDGGIENLPVTYTEQASNFSTQNGTTTVSDSSLTGGDGVELSNKGDYFELTVAPEYRVPHVRIGVRFKCSDAPAVDVSVSGVGEGSFGRVCEQGESKNVQWKELRSFNEDAREFREGDDSTIRIEATTGPGASGGTATIDVVTVYDVRYADEIQFDNSLHTSGGHLDRPRRFASRQELVTNRVDTDANIYRGKVTSTWNDTSNRQGIFIANDEERSFFGTAQTESIDTTLSTYGYGLSTKFSFSYTDATRNDATPRTGYKGQRVTGWTVYGWADTTVVIEGDTFDKNHLENVQAIAEESPLRFYFRHEPSELKLSAQPPRKDTRRFSLPGTGFGVEEFGTMPFGSGTVLQGDTRGELQTKSSAEEYYNRVVVRGATKDDGSRYEGVAADSDDIEARKDAGIEPDTITYRKVNPKLESFTACRSRARRLLDEFRENDERGGSISDVSTAYLDQTQLDPGIYYNVPEWETAVRLRRIRVNSENPSPDLTFEGGERSVLLQRVLSQERETDDIKQRL